MGGFRPSRGDIAGSTIIGSDKDVDSHQFTGSVDITGSLTLNGSAVTGGGGGGGGAVSTYTNAGDNRVITSVNSNTINGEANLSFDGSDLVVAAGDVSASAGVLSSSAGVFFAGNMTGSGHIAIGKIGVGPGGDTIAADVERTATLFVDGEARFQGSVNSSHIPIAGGAENIFLRPGTNSGDVIIADTAATMNVGIGVGSPQAKLHVSSSGTEPLLRIDQSFQAGDKPILFVTGSGLVGIGTASPREDSDNTNRVHILGEEGADQGQNPVVNSVLMLENDNHVGIQFMFPNQKAGQITWGTNLANRKATFYYDSNHNVYSFEGDTYGNTRAVQIHAGGNGVNIGSSNASHMANHTKAANLHISSSTEGVDQGGPVLLKIDHANSDNILYVTGSGRVGIGTASPAANLHVSSSADGDTLLRVDAVDQLAQGFNLVDSAGAVYATINKTAQSTYSLDVGGVARSNQFISTVNGTSYGFKVGADLHHIYSDAGTLTVDAKLDNNVVITTGSIGRVGIGTTSPVAKLHVSSSADAMTLSPFAVQCRGSGSGGETANDFMFCVTGSTINQNTVYIGALSGETITQYADLQVDQNIWLNDGHLYMQGGNPSVRTSNSQQKFAFNTNDNTLDLVNGNVTRVRVFDTSLSSSVPIISYGTVSTSTNLEATGSVKGGLLGATTTETLTSAGALSADVGTSIINVAGQTANAAYAFTIENGTFVGQEKKIYGMALSASSGPTSNNIMISGANIRSNGTTGFLSISGSDQDFGGGAQWVFQSPQAGASLVWDGSKWLIVGNNAFDISYS
mgnify:CR=1 FL=1